MPEAAPAAARQGAEPVYHASLDPPDYVALLTEHGMALRGYLAEDPDCDFHSVWLAQRA